MSCTRGVRSFSHVKRPHYNNDILGEHGDEILKEHDYFYGEFGSQYMPIRLINTLILQLHHRHQSEYIFAGIVRIFNLNKFFHY
jgi:hypothetical protein